MSCISVSKAEIYSLGPEDIYLVHDDLDKALGKVAIKLGGSARYGVGSALCASCFEALTCPYRLMGCSWPHPTSLVMFQLFSWA